MTLATESYRAGAVATDVARGHGTVPARGAAARLADRSRTAPLAFSGRTNVPVGGSASAGR